IFPSFPVTLDLTSSPVAVAVGDFTGSGLFGTQNAIFSLGPLIYTPTGNQVFSSVEFFSESGTSVPWPIEMSGEATALAAGDFNGDGIPDLVVASHGPFDPVAKSFSENKVTVFLNDGHGNFTPLPPLTSPDLPGEPVALAAGHFFGNSH